jgi:hypothetical protein
VAADAPQWVGWCRRKKGGRWFQVCRAPTLAEAALLLCRKGREMGILDRNQILTSGSYPREARAEAGQDASGAEESRTPAPENQTEV